LVRLPFVGLVYLVQHAEKRPEAGDPELTEHGQWQAERTALWLRRCDVGAVYSSPLRRAWQTAEAVAGAFGLGVRRDDRLRERMNWDGAQPIEDFLAEWTRCTSDRDFVPRSGDSSRQAGARLHGFLEELAGVARATVAVTHGGITVDLLRTLLGDEGVPVDLMRNGVPPCAVTVLHGLAVVEVAGADHLANRSYRSDA
jgi:broad specificity phosphatase PhoE